MMSFFGNNHDKSDKSTSTGAIVSRVTVKRPVPKPLLGASTQLPATKVSSKPSVTPSLASSSKPVSSSVLKSKPSSSSSRPKPSSSNLKPDNRLLQHSKTLEPSTSSRSSSSPALVKRKTPTSSRVQSESSSDSGLSEVDSEPESKSKRLKTARGTITPLLLEQDVGRDVFCLGQVDERGEYGRGWAGFVGGEEVVRGVRKGWATGNDPGKGEVEKYVPYFPQEGFAKEDLPSVELLYPAKGCRENFILLAPTSVREYHPLMELRNALRIILDRASPAWHHDASLTRSDYIPPSHQQIFGTLSDSMPDLELNSAPVLSRLQSPLPTSLATPPPESSPAPVTPTETIGDAIRKALAPNRRDGPGFLRAMERFNNSMEEIQLDGSMEGWMTGKQRLKGKEWSALVEMVHDMAYSRVVGPYSHELEHHPKHPDEVSRAISGKEDAYGELRHNFMSKVMELANLGSDSVFVDLGSGVGNCVMQAALQAGCKSYGFELLPVPAHCARLQLREVQRRWAMWGLKGNLDVEVHEGDFRTHGTVAKRLREADVVLVNNEVFPPSLNADLTNLFLDLKEGATIVSLKPFVPDSFRMTESNCDSFAAIARMSQHAYHRDWVSWKGDSGTFYVQVIDRTKRLEFEDRMNGGGKRRKRR